MEESLNKVKNLINSHISSVAKLSPVIEKFSPSFSFGKMLRSKLILSIANKNVIEEAIKVCSIIELIHFASLLHDDVIDNSTTRRGKASINAVFGDKNAIMLGDMLYSKAFYEVSLLDMKLSQIISYAVLKLSLGELEDVELSNDFNSNKAAYLKMIEYKTAALIEAAGECASVLNNEQSDKYKVYGNSLGIAFQIIDDLLDVTQSDEVLGKSSFSDFKEGKCTLPYIYLYEKLSKDDRKILLSYFKKELDSTQKLWIKDKLREHNIISLVQNIAIDYGKEALKRLESSDKKLEIIMKDMIYREF